MPDDAQNIVRRAYRQAVGSLPPLTQDIFLAHLVDGEDLAALAVRHALPAEDVVERLADALMAIDQALRAVGY